MCSSDVEASKPITKTKISSHIASYYLIPHNPISAKVNLIINWIKINNTILGRLYMCVQDKTESYFRWCSKYSIQRYLYKYKTVLKFIMPVTVSLFCRCNLNLRWVLTTHVTFDIYVLCVLLWDKTRPVADLYVMIGF